MWSWISIKFKGRAWLENMVHYGSEICLVLALFLTAYASLQKGPLKIKLQPLPKPFFPQPTLIQDYYEGTLVTPFSDLVTTDLSLVFYYAPWDLQCQNFRPELEKVAKLYQNQITFVAVNCWFPDGECRQHFAKLRAFPLIAAYIRGSLSLQYRGPLSAPSLAAFLSNILKPLSIVDSYQSLIELQARHEAVILGYFDSKKPWKLYNAFHTAALKTLERDPFCSIRYAIATHRLAANQCGIKDHEDLHLFLWNQTLVYPKAVGSLDSEKLLTWLAHRVHSPVSWLNLPLAKSRLFYDTFTSGPTLVYFMPREPLTKDVSLYLQVKDIALRYRNCEQNDRLSRLIRQVRLERIAIQKQYETLRRNCKRWQDLEYQSLAELQFESVRWIYSSKNSTCLVSLSDSNVCPSYCKPSSQACMREYWTEKISEPSVNGSRSARDEKIDKMLRWQREFDCAKLAVDHRASSIQMEDGERNPSLDGLYCRTNRTLSVLVLDSSEHAEIGRRLGLKLNTNSLTGTVIVDTQAESQHILQGQMTSSDLESLILNYTHATSSRHMRVEEVKALPDRKANVMVEEIDGSRFNDVVLDPDTDVVLMLYSRHCTMCSSVSRTFLHAAHHLSVVNQVPLPSNSSNTCNIVPVLNRLKFVRMDAERNELPWHLTVEAYPTIFFFPAGTGRKANSRVFPDHLPITRSNLIRFVTSQLSLWSRFKLLEHESSKRDLYPENSSSQKTLLHSLLQRAVQLKKTKKKLQSQLVDVTRMLNRLSIHRTFFFSELPSPSSRDDRIHTANLSTISVNSRINPPNGNTTSLSVSSKDPWFALTEQLQVLRSQLETSSAHLKRLRMLQCLALETHTLGHSPSLRRDEV